MPTTRLTLAAVLLLAGAHAAAELPFMGQTTAAFASPEQGRAVIGNPDEYVRRMTAFDRMLRMDRAGSHSERAFLDFAATQVTPWPQVERERVSSALAMLVERMAGLRLPLPTQVLLVRTTGHEEEGEAHTRENAIVLPARNLAAAAENGLLTLLAHELFHVATRHDRMFRERAYELIGFRLCPDIPLPAELERRRITNPDAPRLDTYIEVQVRGIRVPVTPLLLTREDFSLERGVALQDYWQLRFLALKPIGGNELQPLMAQGRPVLYAIHELEDFFQQVGNNTQYLIHPEEILADNFALLVSGQTAREPARLAKLKALLEN